MTQAIDKVAVAAAFGRAANHYEHFAELQRLTGDQLLACVGARKPGLVLDAGCGTGWYSRVWQARGSRVVALDLSASMLAVCQQKHSAGRYIEADIEATPLASGSVDLAWSNLALQWCSDLHRALAELYRVTRPGGCIAFTTLASGSLSELHQAWAGTGEPPPVNPFLTVDAIATACQPWHFRLECRPVQQRFPDALSAMRSLKGVGATHLHRGRSPQLMTRGQLQRLTAAWPEEGGHYPLSWNIVYGVIERNE